MKITPQVHELLDQLDAEWQKRERPPDLSAFLGELSATEPHCSVAELVISDLHWRWRFGQIAERRHYSDYALLLPPDFSDRERARILCHEFAVRCRWGDCPTRQQICEQFPELQSLFLEYVEEESAELIDWPTVTLTQGEKTLFSVSLDRPIRAGRQVSRQQRVWHITSSVFEHFIVLCGKSSPLLSRYQLEIRLAGHKQVQVTNPSHNRAILVSGKSRLEAGAKTVLSLEQQVGIQLTEGYQICIN